jgi:hypothetical protein
LVALPLFAQFEEPLNIYGFAQSIYLNKRIDFTIKNDLGGLPPAKGGIKNDAFTMQQLNLFLTRPLGEKYTVFLNTEFTAGYNTRLNSGDMNIEEAWVRYRHSDAVQVKMGQLLPVFNNINEIRNRFPLFPYIIRPIVYESFLEDLFQPSDYLPQRAFLQVSGLLNLNDRFAFEYAVFTGNLEGDYFAQRSGTGTGIGDENYSIYKGEELSGKSQWGGRVGVKKRDESFKAGFSTTRDFDFRQEVSTFSLARFPVQQIPILGDVERYRFAFDLSFNAGPFQVETEYIRVQHINTPVMDALGLSLDKDFFYSNLTWNVNDRTFMYGNYSFMRNKAFEYVMQDSPDYKGLNVVTAGGGYKPNDYLVAKVQGVYAFVNPNPYVTITTAFVTVGLTVLF